MPIVRRAFRTKSKFAIDAGDYGLIGDGNVHPLSERYGSLGAAQDDYPFVIALTQQIDYCAIKSASNDCFGAELEVLIDYELVTDTSDDLHIIDDTQNWAVNEFAGKTAFRRFESNGFVTSAPILSNTSDTITLAAPMPFGAITAGNSYAIGYGEHGTNFSLNKKLRIPSSVCSFGDDTWLLRNLGSAHIEGEGGRLVTTLRGNQTLIRTDGLWYSTIQQLQLLLQNPAGITAFDIDGNVPDHPYATRGVQGNTFANMLIDGGGAQQAFSMLRQGGSGGQGSENTYNNLHLQNAIFALYYQNGFNALGNKFYGGNFQNYPKYGIYCIGAACDVHSAFQSTRGYQQIEEDGYDIRMGDAGAQDSAMISGCRTESLRFFHGLWPVVSVISGCTGNVALNPWFSGTTYGPAQTFGKAVHYGGRLFYTNTVGVSGGTIPDFDSVPDGGTIVDNTITWTELPINFIKADGGNVDKRSIRWDVGKLDTKADNYLAGNYTADHVMEWFENYAAFNCTAGPLTCTLRPGAKRGDIVTVLKMDASANALTIVGGIGFVDAGVERWIPGGVRGSRTFIYGMESTGTDRWALIGESNRLGGENNLLPQTYTAAWTLALIDNNRTLEMNSATPAAFTIPPNATVPMPIGAYVEMVQIGAGLMSVAAGAGVTIEPSGALNSQGQWKAMSAYQRSLNNWVVIGGVA